MAHGTSKPTKGNVNTGLTGKPTATPEGLYAGSGGSINGQKQAAVDKSKETK